MDNITIKDVTGVSKIIFKKSLHSLEEIQSACYLYTEYASFLFDDTDLDIEVEVTVFPSSDLNSDDIAHLVKNQVFIESLRTKIAIKTEAERNLILAYAFSNTPLVN
jgi:His-Xaa-Ser system protein HxsD